MIAVDATCPLVTKVHNEAQRHSEAGLQMVMIGHAGHPETIGTMGQLPEGEVLLVETAEDVAGLRVRDAGKLAYITQTVGVTAGASAPEVLVNEVIEAFRARFDLDVELVETALENIEFKVPRILRETV